MMILDIDDFAYASRYVSRYLPLQANTVSWQYNGLSAPKRFRSKSLHWSL